MTKGTRIFLLGAGGILVLGLGTGVLASYMGIQNVITGGGVGPDELAYIPPDTQVLAYANVREVLDSELRAKVMALATDGGQPGDGGDGRDGRDELFEATGLDLERDVDSLVASFSGTEENALPIVVARGTFNPALIESAIMQHAEGRARVETYQGIRLVFGTGPDANSYAVAFAGPGLVVLGSEPGVRRALDAKTSGSNVIDNSEVMNLVRDSEDGNAWAVARFDALAARAVPQDIANHLPPITWFAAKGHINGGLRATLRAETRDDASGQNLREVIRGFLALARLQAGQRAEFAELLNTLELSGTGKTVQLGFAVDSAIIDALGALRPRGGSSPFVPPAPPVPSEPPPPVL